MVMVVACDQLPVPTVFENLAIAKHNVHQKLGRELGSQLSLFRQLLILCFIEHDTMCINDEPQDWTFGWNVLESDDDCAVVLTPLVDHETSYNIVLYYLAQPRG
jgi:hypothetical protein